jgi:hypothetical protein
MAINDLRAGTALPSKAADGNSVYQRGDGYGNAYTRPLGKRSATIAEGANYYIARNATVGTGLDSDADATTVEDGEAFIHIYNNAASGGTSIALDYIKIRVITAGASGTTTGFFTKVYRGNTRYSSGGTAITPVNCNAASSETADCTMYAGAVQLSTANGSERLLSAQLIRSVIAVAGDHYWFDFGPDQMSAHNGLVVSGTAISNLVVPCSPVVLGPQSGFQFGLYGASQATAANYEFEVGFYEL